MSLSFNDIPDPVGLFAVIELNPEHHLLKVTEQQCMRTEGETYQFKILQDANTLRIESTGLLIFQSEASASPCQASETVMAELPNLSCVRCGHNWIARRHRRPFACPRCQSTCWDEPAVALSRFRVSKGPSSKNGSSSLRIPGSFSRTLRTCRSGLLNEARAPNSEHHV